MPFLQFPFLRQARGPASSSPQLQNRSSNAYIVEFETFEPTGVGPLMKRLLLERSALGVLTPQVKAVAAAPRGRTGLQM